MKDIKIKDSLLRVSSQRGFDAFVQVFVDAINKSIDGNLTPDSMHQLSADQITLLGWNFLRNEVLEVDIFNLFTTVMANSFSTIRLEQLCVLGDLLNWASRL